MTAIRKHTSGAGGALSVASPFSALATTLSDGTGSRLLEPMSYLAAGELPQRPPAIERAELARWLEESNAAQGHPRSAELSEKLADPETSVVVTGQQPGIFGGPFYTVVKAIAAVLWARALEESGRKAVPVFWVATEDHDYAEVTQCHFPRVELEVPPDASPLEPVGRRPAAPFCDPLRRLCEQLPEHLAPCVKRCEECYAASDATIGRAFVSTLCSWLGSAAPLFADAQAPELKRLQRPILRRLIDDRQAVDAALVRSTQAVHEAGFTPQVRHREGASPLFLCDEGEDRSRRRIEWMPDGDRCRLRGTGVELTVEQLREIVEDAPQRLSPGVLARPAVQDAVFGSSLLVLGPGELSYMAQASSIYPVLDVQAPATTLRPRAVVLGSREQKLLSKLGAESIGLADVLGPEKELDDRLAGRADLAWLETLRNAVDTASANAKGRALALDPHLERPWQKTTEQMNRSLDLFAQKTRASAARQDELLRSRIESLRDRLAPGGVPQERIVTSLHLMARFGPALVEALQELSLDPSSLQGVALDG